MLLPYTILVRLSTLIDPVPYIPKEENTLLTRSLYKSIDEPLTQAILAILLIFLQAVFINRLVIKNRLGLSITLVSGMIYILLVSLIPSFTTLSPTLIINTLLIWTLSEMFSLYNKTHTAISIFNSGLAIGIATIISPSCILLLILCFLALIIIKSYNLVDFFQVVTGFITSIYITYSIAILCNIDVSRELDSYSLGINFYKYMDISNYPYIFIYVLAALIICIFGYNKNTIKKSIQSQKKIDILYWVLFVGFLIAMISNPLESHISNIIAVPSSVLVTMWILRLKSKVFQEFLHLVLLTILFYLHFSFL